MTSPRAFIVSAMAVLLLALNACGGKSLHLDADSGTPDTGGTAGASGSSSELVIGKQRNARALALDEERLYWVTWAGVEGCSKADCAGTHVEYDSFRGEADAVLAVGGIRFGSGSRLFSTHSYRVPRAAVWANLGLWP
ncbi:MAG: hypothetical protein QM756_35445 [Polyangiaceae bacterium]